MSKENTEAKIKITEEKETKNYKTFLKIICTMLALLLWFYVSYDKNTSTDTTFKNIPVSIIGTERLEERNLAVLSSELYASVKLSGARNILSRVNKADIKAVVDVSDITTAGVQNPLITIMGIPDSLSVQERKIVSGKLVTDVLVKKSLDLNIDFVGKMADTVVEGEKTVIPTQVTVKGPATLLSDITAWTDAIDISNVKSSENIFNSGIVLKNSIGEAVRSDMITVSDAEATVTLKCQGKKEIEVLPPEIVGSLSGYNVIVEKIEPATVVITGALEDIELIDSVSLEPVDAYYAGTSKTIRSELVFPENIYCETTRVNITLGVRSLSEELDAENTDSGE